MDKIINIAVVAHVDVGKSTLVDALLSQCGMLDKELNTHQIMDSNELEKNVVLQFILRIVLLDIKIIRSILLILLVMLIFLQKLSVLLKQ